MFPSPGMRYAKSDILRHSVWFSFSRGTPNKYSVEYRTVFLCSVLTALTNTHTSHKKQTGAAKYLGFKLFMTTSFANYKDPVLMQNSQRDEYKINGLLKNSS